MKETHSFSFHDYFGRNVIGKPCHVYELRDWGEVICQLNNEIQNGTENDSAVQHFQEKAERVMDRIVRQEGTALN